MLFGSLFENKCCSLSRGACKRLLWREPTTSLEVAAGLNSLQSLKENVLKILSLILSIPNIQWCSKYLRATLGLLYSALGGFFIVPIFQAHFRVLSCLPGALWLCSAPLLVLSWCQAPGSRSPGRARGVPTLRSAPTDMGGHGLNHLDSRAGCQGEPGYKRQRGHGLRDHHCRTTVSQAGPQ